MKRRLDGTGDVQAKLEGASEWTPPPLHFASVAQIGRGGMMLKGVEIIPKRSNNKAGVLKHRQVWWLVTEASALLPVTLSQLEQEQRQEIGELRELEARAGFEGLVEAEQAEAQRLRTRTEARMLEIERLRMSIERKSTLVTPPPTQPKGW